MRLAQKLRAIAVLIFSLISNVGAESQDWKVLEDQTLGFRIELPGAPTLSRDPATGSFNLSLSVEDLSIEIAHMLTRDTFEFDAFVSEYKKEVVDLFNLPLLEQRSFVWNAHRAIDLTLSAPGHHVLVRLIAANTFVMIIVASDSNPLTESTVLARVLKSLSLF
jgi:hypothetical protein